MDQKVFTALNSVIGKSHFVDDIFRFTSVYLIYAIPLFLIIYWFWGDKKIALRSFLAGVVAWFGFSKLIAYFYFRSRPETIFSIKELMFHRPDASFPSDHAAFLFAVAFSFFLAGKKTTSYWLFAIGIIISVSRIATGFHWPSDVLVGWVLGIFATWLVWIFREPIDKFVIDPIIWAAKKIRL